MVPLVGIISGNVTGGLTNYLVYQYEMAQTLSTWTTDRFSMMFHGQYEPVHLIIPLVTLAFPFANHFNTVGMRKDFSKNLSVPYDLMLFLGLIIVAMIIVSVAVVMGSILYISPIVPNMVAVLKGNKVRDTLMDMVLSGAVFILGRDMIGQVIIAPYEFLIELTMGILGNLIFVVLLLYRLRHDRKMIRPTGDGTGYGCAPATHLDGGDTARTGQARPFPSPPTRSTPAR